MGVAVNWYFPDKTELVTRYYHKVFQVIRVWVLFIPLHTLHQQAGSRKSTLDVRQPL